MPRLTAARRPRSVWGRVLPPWMPAAVAFIGLSFRLQSIAAAAGCRGTGPWVLVQLRANDWNDVQRDSVLLDLQHTLAPQGIDACLAAAHPPGEPLATLVIEVGPENRASVDIEVRDTMTQKRLKRDVDLARIPVDGRAAAIAIESDELMRAHFANVGLDRARAEAGERRSGLVEVEPVPEAPQILMSGAFGARAAVESYLGGATLLGGDVLGRRSLSRRFGLELSVGVRASPSVASTHGRVHALGAGPGLGLFFRIAGAHAASIDGGVIFSASWLEFRAAPDPGAEGSSYANLLVTGRLRLVGRVGLGRALHISAGVNGGAALHGVEATDTGRVADRATGVELGAVLGLEAP